MIWSGLRRSPLGLLVLGIQNRSAGGWDFRDGFSSSRRLSQAASQGGGRLGEKTEVGGSLSLEAWTGNSPAMTPAHFMDQSKSRPRLNLGLNDGSDSRGGGKESV